MSPARLLLQGTSVQAEYIWIGGSGEDLRCKSMTLDKVPTSCDELPIWNFDGSSTGQAPGHDSEVLLKPVCIVPDPFRGHPNVLVLAECLAPDMTPIPTNTRNAAAKIFERAPELKPWYGLEQVRRACPLPWLVMLSWATPVWCGCERARSVTALAVLCPFCWFFGLETNLWCVIDCRQEYALFHADKRTPLGWPKDGFPGPQGPYYWYVAERVRGAASCSLCPTRGALATCAT